MNFSTQLRHFLSFLAGLGTMFAGWHLIAPDQVESVNQAGADLILPLAAILGAVGAGLFRLAIAWLGKIFSGIAGKASGINSGGSLLLMICGTMAGIMGCLPSCSALTGDSRRQDTRLKTGAWGGRVKACYSGPDGRVCYSSADGLEVLVDRSGK